MPTEHQDSRESDNHERDVVELSRAIGAAIEDNRDNEDEHTTSEYSTRFGQTHAGFADLAAIASGGITSLGETVESAAEPDFG